MSYTVLSHVATGDLATAALQNQLIDDLAVLKTSIANDGTISGTASALTFSGTATFNANIAMKAAGNVNVTGAVGVTNGLTFGTNILTIDFADGRVGVGTTAPGALFDVNGNFTVTGSGTVAAVSGATSGAWTVGGLLTATGTIKFAAGNVISGAVGGSSVSFPATLTGGTGQPTAAPQVGWITMKNSAGATIWIPYWQ